ncbi:unnamed protein product, partial [Adineta ricciae]
DPIGSVSDPIGILSDSYQIRPNPIGFSRKTGYGNVTESPVSAILSDPTVGIRSEAIGKEPTGNHFRQPTLTLLTEAESLQLFIIHQMPYLKPKKHLNAQ